MKILIFTHNLNADNRHLMPWRTVCEVVEHLNSFGHLVEIVSLGSRNREGLSSLREIRKSKTYLLEGLTDVVNCYSPDVIFWPLTWRESSIRLKLVKKMNVPLVGYFPGGYYFFSAVFYALKRIGFAKTAPYFLEAFFEKIRGADFFRQYGVQNVITMSRLHGEMVRKAGWLENEVFHIPPGKDDNICDVLNSNDSLPDDFTAWLVGRQYFLFMGPPGAIRGVFELLEAFELVAGKQDGICLVCLFRADAVLDSVKIRNKIASSKFSARIFTEWQSVGKGVLQSFIKRCHAILLPFVLVPSEIPLAIIESMAWGKPVISTVPGGTGEFVRGFGAVADLGDIEGLASAMVRLINDDKYYQERCKLTSEEYYRHPNWHKVASKWLQVGEAAVLSRVVNKGSE